jgi:hypothetical protein
MEGREAEEPMSHALALMHAVLADAGHPMLAPVRHADVPYGCDKWGVEHEWRHIGGGAVNGHDDYCVTCGHARTVLTTGKED